MHDLDRLKKKRELRVSPAQMIWLGLGTVVFSGVLFYVGFLVGGFQPGASSQPPQDIPAHSMEDTPEDRSSPTVVAALGEVEFLIPAGPLRISREHSIPSDAPSQTQERATGQSPQLEPPKDTPRAEADDSTLIAQDIERGASQRPAPGLPKIKSHGTSGAQVVAQADAPMVDSVLSQSSKPSERRPSPVVIEAAQKTPVTQKSSRSQRPKTTQKLAGTQPAAAQRTMNRMAKTGGPKRALPKYTGQGRARFTLQVKATKDASVADEFLQGLRKAGFYPHKILVELPNKGRFYRIRVGRFETMEEARAFQRHYAETSGSDDGGFITRL